MKTYTVIGVYDSTGQVYATSTKAKDYHEAMANVANEVDEDDRDDLQIVCAMIGELIITPPCEDSGKTAYCSDLCAILEDDE